jgi:hypothetical protein
MPQPNVDRYYHRIGVPYPYARTADSPYTIGWQRFPDQKGGARFVVLRLAGRGRLKVVQSYPLTHEGWAQAWEALVALDPAAADAVRQALSPQAGTLRQPPASAGGGLPAAPSGVLAAGASAAAGRTSAQASPASSPGSLPAHAGGSRARAQVRRLGAYAQGHRAGVTPVNVIIAVSLLCGAIGTLSGAAGALTLTLVFWSMAGAPYAVAMLALLCYLPVTGAQAIARRRRSASPPPSQQAASPP